MSSTLLPELAAVSVEDPKAVEGRRPPNTVPQPCIASTPPEVRSIAAADPTMLLGDVRHLPRLREQLGASLKDMAVVTSGKYAYQRQDRVAVIPAVLLGP